MFAATEEQTRRAGGQKTRDWRHLLHKAETIIAKLYIDFTANTLTMVMVNVYVQTDQSLHFANSSYCWFCHAIVV